MNDSQISRTREQLEFVKDILATTVDSDNVSLTRERVTLAIERIALIEELLSDVRAELERVRSQGDEIRRERSVELAIKKEKLQSREFPKASGDHDRRDSSLRSQGQLFPDQGLIDSYSDLARKYGKLRRAIQLMRGDVESAARNIDEFWIGDDETKRFVMDKLRAAVAIKEEPDI
jgi:hypothetical protein